MLTRIIVLPFRLLKPDPDTDFLGFSLADAISASLAGLDSIVVRSSLTAVQLAGGTPNLRAIAEQAAVDVVLTGSLLRVGSQVRVAAQLVEVPQGSLLWSHTIQAPVDDLFQLQDSHHARHRLIAARPARRAGSSATSGAMCPASAGGLRAVPRANQLMTETGRWPEARALVRAGGAAAIPGYAPAWARLGRVLRVLSKYGGPDPEADLVRAERAFERALALNPDLDDGPPLLLAPRGGARARQRSHGAAAHPCARTAPRRGPAGGARHDLPLLRAARRIGGGIRARPSSRSRGAHERGVHVLSAGRARPRDRNRRWISTASRPSCRACRLGDRARAIAALRDLERTARVRHGAAFSRVSLSRRRWSRALTMRDATRQLRASSFRDPEGRVHPCHVSLRGRRAGPALTALEVAVRGGFHCPSSMRADPQWSGGGRLAGVRAAARTRRTPRHQRAREAFEAADGPEILAQHA